MRNQGFTLIESVMYLLLSACAISLVASALCGLTRASRIRMAAARDFLNRVVCEQHLRAHLKRAPMRIDGWYVCDDHSLVYQVGDRAIGWFYEHRSIVKCTGLMRSGHLMRMSSALILQDVDFCRFSRTSERGVVKALGVLYGHGDRSNELSVALCIGAVT